MRLIDADALIDVLTQRCCKNCIKRMGTKNGKRKMIYEIGDAPCKACEVDDMKVELDDAPTIDVKPIKHGKWIPKTVSSGRDSWECSECGRRARGKIENLPYCHCGAKMDEVNNE